MSVPTSTIVAGNWAETRFLALMAGVGQGLDHNASPVSDTRLLPEERAPSLLSDGSSINQVVRTGWQLVWFLEVAKYTN